MKILFLSDDLQGGGKQRRLVQLIRGLHADREMELHLVLLDHRESASRTGRKTVDDVKELVDFPEIWNYKVTIHFLERKSRRDLGIFPRLSRLVDEIRPDIVNVWSVMGCFYALPILVGRKTTLVTSFVADCNGPRFPSPWWFLTRLAYSRSRIVTGNSSAGLRSYRVPAAKARTIYNGFDFGRFADVKPLAEMRRELGISTRFAMAMTARFDPTKDYKTFIRAFLETANFRDDLTAVCIGQGPDLEDIRAMIPDHLRNKVVFTGYRKDVESILSACDFSVLCTNATLHGEGISNSILEGMAAGHPVIATNDGGSPEIVVDGETGYLVPPNDPTALSKKMLELISTPDRMRDMGESSRNRIKASFSLEKMTSEFVATFRKAAEQ